MLSNDGSYMAPRPFLIILVALLLIASSSSTTSAHPSSHCPPLSPSCKTVPGDANWPSPATWARLNESTGGRLLSPTPPGAVCHPGQASYDADKCPAVTAAWSKYQLHSDDPVSGMSEQYNNDTCLPNPADPCSGQGYPVFVVNATNAKHVRLGVDFARKHNIRLVIKSSGHDFQGRSSGPNSLSIWVHHVKGMQYHDSFQLKGCNTTVDGPALTAGGGQQVGDIYTFLNPYNQTIVGGSSSTVSLGGYLSGGGHSLLSSKYGMGADQVLEIEVVTPTGEIFTANECQNTDLFWALRGGGGSTFGITTSVTLKTYPSPSLISTTLLVIANNSTTPSLFPMIAYMLSQLPSLSDAGVSGYTYMATRFPAGNASYAGFLASVVLPDGTQDAMARLWAPALAQVNRTWPGEFTVGMSFKQYASYQEWFAASDDNTPTGKDSYVGSRLLDEKALTADLDKSADAYRRFAAGGVATAYMVAGPGVRDAKPRGGGDAVLPAWRRAYVHATLGVDFQPVNATAKADAIAKTNTYVQALRELAPDMGAYVNEAPPFEPDWQHTFWGDHYDRLVSIKRAVDPDDVLWCHPCVGNERWKEVDGKLCMV